VTKKVTAVGKFAKTAPQKAKNLNVADYYFNIFPISVTGNVNFFNAFYFAV
jgi:hypothetical protein